MTVAELIAELQRFPMDLPVLRENTYGIGFLFEPLKSVAGEKLCRREDGSYCRFGAPHLKGQNKDAAIVLR